MELYTWPEDRVKILINKKELFENGLDPHQGFVSNHEAELFFSKLLHTICNHFNWNTDIHIDAEIRESEQDAIFLIIDCLDEKGNKLKQEQSTSPYSILFRFAREEDVLTFAKRAEIHGLTGGTYIFFYPCYYLLFDPFLFKNADKIIMLLEEYGERSPLNPDYIREKGKIISNDSALQFIFAKFE
ncbi:negative regulator of genetic competence, sporulation and motility [Salibacterium salarium]|uniref:adaptor protein MecA n=1 Tax=Salibacterium salarium TaxID=284579 RepID=UPI00278B131E|nr:adaptor protein MecA [Salibacterium salarium]MDQ0299471.1 negative regulator of genetic competence, sporulation and motility [Salibacterium salarium]